MTLIDRERAVRYRRFVLFATRILGRKTLPWADLED